MEIKTAVQGGGASRFMSELCPATMGSAAGNFLLPPPPPPNLRNLTLDRSPRQESLRGQSRRGLSAASSPSTKKAARSQQCQDNQSNPKMML